MTTLGASGIPEVALRAYVRGERTTALTDPSCGLRWWLLAAIGRVESNHGRFGGVRLRDDGYGTKRIRGIPLDGRPGVAQIRDTDHGAWDGDPLYDRAVGPMQFIPSTWRRVAVDGNADGRQDPDNFFDAALAAANYLCAGGADLRHPAGQAAAVLRYNRSAEYVAVVLALARAYAGRTPSLPEVGPARVPPPPRQTVPSPASVGWSPEMRGVLAPDVPASPRPTRPPSTTSPSTTSPSTTTSTTSTPPASDPSCPPGPTTTTTTSSTTSTSTTTTSAPPSTSTSPASDAGCPPTSSTTTSTTPPAPTTTSIIPTTSATSPSTTNPGTG